MTEARLLSESATATEEFAARLAALLPAGALLALDGELGAGKTTFVRGLARGLGVQGPVSSPTFTLMHLYPGPRPLFHFDAWMQGREEAFLRGGGAEHMAGEGIAAVEWGERVAAWLPCPRLALEFAHRGVTEREIAVRLVSADGSPGSADVVLALRLSEALRRALDSLPQGVRRLGGPRGEPRPPGRVGKPEAP